MLCGGETSPVRSPPGLAHRFVEGRARTLWAQHADVCVLGLAATEGGRSMTDLARRQRGVQSLRRAHTIRGILLAGLAPSLTFAALTGVAHADDAPPAATPPAGAVI